MKKNHTSLITRILILSSLFFINSNCLFAQKKKSKEKEKTKMMGVALSAVYSEIISFQYKDASSNTFTTYEYQSKAKLNFPVYEIYYSVLEKNTINSIGLYNLKYSNYEVQTILSNDSIINIEPVILKNRANNFESGLNYSFGKRMIKFKKSSISGVYIIGSFLGQMTFSNNKVIMGNFRKTKRRALKLGLSFEPRYIKEWRNNLIFFVGMPIKVIDFTNWYYKSEGDFLITSSKSISDFSTPLLKNVGFTIGLAIKL